MLTEKMAMEFKKEFDKRFKHREQRITKFYDDKETKNFYICSIEMSKRKYKVTIVKETEEILGFDKL